MLRLGTEVNILGKTLSGLIIRQYGLLYVSTKQGVVKMSNYVGKPHIDILHNKKHHLN